MKEQCHVNRNKEMSWKKGLTSSGDSMNPLCTSWATTSHAPSCGEYLKWQFVYTADLFIYLFVCSLLLLLLCNEHI